MNMRALLPAENPNTHTGNGYSDSYSVAKLPKFMNYYIFRRINNCGTG